MLSFRKLRSYHRQEYHRSRSNFNKRERQYLKRCLHPYHVWSAVFFWFLVFVNRLDQREDILVDKYRTMTEHFSWGRLKWTRVTYEPEILRFHFRGNLLLHFEWTFHNTQIQRFPSFDNRDAFFCLKFVFRTERFCVDSCWGNVGRQRRCENCWKIKYLSFIAVEKKEW